MKPFKLVPWVSLSLVLAVSAIADFKPRRGEFTIDRLEEAREAARNDGKPLTFIYTNPNTSCGLARGMFDDVCSSLRSRSVLVFINSQNGEHRSRMPGLVTSALSAPESGQFIPKTVVVDPGISRVLAHVPYTREERERSRVLRDARFSINDHIRQQDNPAAQAATGPRTWTDLHGRRVEGTYVSSTQTHVTIRAEDGAEIAVELDRLSAADRHFVHMASRP